MYHDTYIPLQRLYYDLYRDMYVSVAVGGTLGCVFIDNETHESGVTKCTTGEAWSAFSWHHSSVSLSMNTQPSNPAFITHAYV